MRRFSCILLAFILICHVLSGCRRNDEDGMPALHEKEYDTRLIKAVPGESINTKGLTKLDEFSYDLDLDNSEERAELYTAAERNEKGEIAWDDGQDWLLVVWDGEKAYPLLSQYVQLGNVYFSVSNYDGGGVPHINAIVSTGAGFSLKTYGFDKNKGGFVENVAYTSKDNNFIHTSIPGY